MTALFDNAFAHTVLDPNVEGGFVLTNLATDPGGMTFAGISRRYHPTWYGWELIDKGTPASSSELREAVKSFYYASFWVPINGENLPARLGVHVFDMAVNSGPDDAAIALQTSLGTVKPDGDIGPKTLAAVRQSDINKVLFRFFAARLRHYTTKPSRQAWQDNGRGWVNRTAHMLLIAGE